MVSISSILSQKINFNSFRLNTRIFFILVWHRIKDEINGEERKRSNEYGDYYFCK